MRSKLDEALGAWRIADAEGQQDVITKLCENFVTSNEGDAVDLATRGAIRALTTIAHDHAIREEAARLSKGEKGGAS